MNTTTDTVTPEWLEAQAKADLLAEIKRVVREEVKAEIAKFNKPIGIFTLPVRPPEESKHEIYERIRRANPSWFRRLLHRLFH